MALLLEKLSRQVGGGAPLGGGALPVGGGAPVVGAIGSSAEASAGIGIDVGPTHAPRSTSAASALPTALRTIVKSMPACSLAAAGTQAESAFESTSNKAEHSSTVWRMESEISRRSASWIIHTKSSTYLPISPAFISRACAISSPIVAVSKRMPVTHMENGVCDMWGESVGW